MSFDSTLPTRCVMARIYRVQISYFPILALGVYHSESHNIRIDVINTDNQTTMNHLTQTIRLINGLIRRPDFVMLLGLGEPTLRNDFGYAMSDRALTYLYQQEGKSSSLCQYVLFTNADSCYPRNLVKAILPHMIAGKDLIAWNSVRMDRRKGTIYFCAFSYKRLI